MYSERCSKRKVDASKIKKNPEKHKKRIIDTFNKNREDCAKELQERYIKNYKPLGHKKLSKYKNTKLERVHPCNIKRPQCII